MAKEWIVWQLADSAFPSGGFAHSSGLEAAYQLGIVRDRATLESFLITSTKQLQSGVGRLMERAWRDPERFVEIDEECDLFLNNHVANRASRAQGRSFLSSAARTFDSDPLKQLVDTIREDRSPAHFAVVFGVVTKTLAIDDAIELFRFMMARSILSSAVRLGIIGPMEGQQMQASLRGMGVSPMNSRLEPLAHGRDAHATNVSPILDLIQANHDRLYSKLFQS